MRWVRAWDMTNEFSLNQAAKVLFILGAITDKELAQISDFNRVRNNIVHKLFWDPHDEQWKGVPKVEYTKVFRVGLRLCEAIENKSGDVVAKQKPSNKAFQPTRILPR